MAAQAPPFKAGVSRPPLLYVALVLHVLLHYGERRSAYGRNKVAVRPQGGKPSFQRGELRPQIPARPPFDEADEFVYAVLGVAIHEEMHVVGHGLQLQYLTARLLADFLDYLLEAFVHGTGVSLDWRIVEFRVEAGYHLSTVFRAPYDVVVASVCHVVVVFHLVHFSHAYHYTPLFSYK